MEKRDDIAELFQKGLENHSSPVNNKIWEKVSTNLATPGGSAVLTKSIWKAIAFSAFTGIVIVSLIVGYIKYNSSDEKNSSSQNEQINENKALPIRINPEDSTKNKIIPPAKPFIEPIQVKNHVITNQKESDLVAMESKTQDQTKPMLVIKEHREDDLVAEEVNEPNEDVTQTITEPATEELLASEAEKNPVPKFNITLPNIFTPNNDGSNDLFELDLSELNDISFVVMDQNGSIVYTSNQKIISWNGFSSLGDKLASGRYLYIITGFDPSGELFKQYSNLDIRY